MSIAPLLVLQLDPSDPPARLGEWLREAGLELDVRALDAGDPLPHDLDGHCGVVVLGGEMGAFDDDKAPFLPAVRALLRDAVTTETPTLGVCLGHQLLAGANGGRIARCADGPEFGAQLVAKRTATSDDPLFAALPITPDVLQWHVDEVAELPRGAIQLAGSPGCEHQAFRLGRLAWGIQFHIETTPDMVREWARDGGTALDGYDVDLLVDRAVRIHDDLAEVWQPFAARFADVVRAPEQVAASRAVPSSSAAPLTDAAAIRAALAAELTASRSAPVPMPLPMPGVRPQEG